MSKKLTKPPTSIEDMEYQSDVMGMIVDRWLNNGGMNDMKRVMREAFSEVMEEKLQPIHTSIYSLKIVSYSTAVVTLLILIYHAITL